MAREYYVTVWDVDVQGFVPHPELPAGPYSLWGLRVPLRALGTFRGDPSVSVSDEPPETLEQIAAHHAAVAKAMKRARKKRTARQGELFAALGDIEPKEPTP